MSTKTGRFSTKEPNFDQLAKIGAGCGGCGTAMPEGTTYMDAIQLDSEKDQRIWRYYCAGCQEKLEEPYTTRLAWEAQRWVRDPLHG